MSVVVVIAVLAGLILLERYWAAAALKALQRSDSCDRVLTEPGEPVTWVCRIENRGRLPIPFVRLRAELPAGAQLQADPEWIAAHCRRGEYHWHVELRLALRPMESAVQTLRFTLPSRGVYTVGSGSLAAGDLLGFREVTRAYDGCSLVVMPEQAQGLRIPDTAGGFLGDISVRRFILEDPILTVGFRDYTGREPFKAISWTRTAMTGTLQVRQYDHTSERTAVVLLNVSGASAQALEACFRMTRTVCQTLERRKLPFALRTNGNLPGPVGKLFYQAEGLGGSHLNAILYGLGRADSTCYFALNTLVTQALRGRKSSDAYILISPPLSPSDWDAIHRLEAVSAGPVRVLEVTS